LTIALFCSILVVSATAGILCWRLLGILDTALHSWNDRRQKLFNQLIDELCDVRRAVVSVLDRTAERLAPPELEKHEPLPNEVRSWINQESESWARGSLERRAHVLFAELESWESVLQILIKEQGVRSE
jgi:hypothetical protein